MKECKPEDTLVSLKEYFDIRIAAQEKATLLNNENNNIRFTAIEKSTTLAANAMEKRLEGMNEFRDQLRKQAGRFVTREELDLKFDTLNSKIESIQRPIWIGLGIALTLEFIFKFFVH